MGARENILNRIKEAGNKRAKVELEQPEWKSSVYLKQERNLAENFRKNLELVAGKVIRTLNLESAAEELKKILSELDVEKPFCADLKLKKALKEKIEITALKKDFANMKVGITPAEFLVAHLGSVLISSSGASGRRLHVFPETHIIIAHEGQLVNYLEEGIDKIREKYDNQLPSMITNITGPSRTADIEKTLVMGMHGPKKLFVLLCEEPF